MEDDERREAAIASAAFLNPKFKPQSSASQARISKLQELHKRRLQIKEKSKTKKKSKGKDQRAESKTVEDTSDFVIESQSKDKSSVTNDNVAAERVSKKPQKLHWGLDTKERWERKSNM